MLDHIALKVKDVAKSKDFYSRALAPLGYGIVMEFEGGAGFGAGPKPDFWIRKGGRHATAVHVAFHSPDRNTVDAFYAAAIGAGGLDNGEPGIRPQYHPNYYGAFVFDPDGNNIEAVCHDPEG